MIDELIRFCWLAHTKKQQQQQQKVKAEAKQRVFGSAARGVAHSRCKHCTHSTNTHTRVNET